MNNTNRQPMHPMNIVMTRILSIAFITLVAVAVLTAVVTGKMVSIW